MVVVLKAKKKVKVSTKKIVKKVTKNKKIKKGGKSELDTHTPKPYRKKFADIRRKIIKGTLGIVGIGLAGALAYHGLKNYNRAQNINSMISLLDHSKEQQRKADELQFQKEIIRKQQEIDNKLRQDTINKEEAERKKRDLEQQQILFVKQQEEQRFKEIKKKEEELQRAKRDEIIKQNDLRRQVLIKNQDLDNKRRADMKKMAEEAAKIINERNKKKEAGETIINSPQVLSLSQIKLDYYANGQNDKTMDIVKAKMYIEYTIKKLHLADTVQCNLYDKIISSGLTRCNTYYSKQTKDFNKCIERSTNLNGVDLNVLLVALRTIGCIL